MSKIMSMFEKLNLVEKVNTTETELSSEDIDAVEKESNPAKQEELVLNTPVLTPSEAKKEPKTAVKSNYTLDKNMSIEDIYFSFELSCNGVNTIFMLEKFINALPEKLPHDVKKQSVINILEASDASLTQLISDGEKRLETLNKFSKDFYNSTTEAVEQYKVEIAKLNNLIKSYEEKIYLRESMLLEQNSVIKTETEKINSTINFFKSNN